MSHVVLFRQRFLDLSWRFEPAPHERGTSSFLLCYPSLHETNPWTDEECQVRVAEVRVRVRPHSRLEKTDQGRGLTRARRREDVPSESEDSPCQQYDG